MRRILKLLAVAALCAYGGVLALLYVKQREMMYPRNPARAEIASANLPGVEEATLTVPDSAAANHPAHRGGRQGRHTEELGYVLAEMQYLPRAYPGAKW